jgi:hypothetical protein
MRLADFLLTFRGEAFLEESNMPKKLESDEDARTSPVILFHGAHSYWKGATTLDQADLKTTHPSSPISFLYYHAIELYLKSFLRLHGHPMRELRGKKFGHRTCCLTDRAAQLGLPFMDEDIEIFSLMITTEVIIRSRYLQTGYGRWPTHEGLHRVCKSLHESVGPAIQKRGLVVRV